MNDSVLWLAFTTFSSEDEARRVGRQLVEENLAACANIIPGVTSIYRWENALEETTEVQMLLKTTAESLPPLHQRLFALHSYDTPEFFAIPLEHVDQRYAAWAKRQCHIEKE